MLKILSVKKKYSKVQKSPTSTSISSIYTTPKTLQRSSIWVSNVGFLIVEFLAQLEVLLDLEWKSSFIMFLAHWLGVIGTNSRPNARWQRAGQFPGHEV